MFQKCVLIVEDSSAQALAKLLLLEDTGLRVLWARNGQEGMDLAKRYLPDAIVLDVEMPDMNGFEVCRRLKADEYTASIPIIMHTVRDEAQAVAYSLELGAIDFIPKDVFSGQVLRATLQELNIIEEPLPGGVRGNQ